MLESITFHIHQEAWDIWNNLKECFRPDPPPDVIFMEDCHGMAEEDKQHHAA